MPNEISECRRFYWSIRRELWEYRSLYVAPLAVAALIVLGFLVSTMHTVKRMHAAMALDPVKRQAMIEQPYDLVALLIMGAAFLVTLFYCLDTLQGERRDRSILFWKSLPVSDRTTVLAKASIAIVGMPLVAFTVTMLTYAAMLVLTSVALAGSDVSLTAFLQHLPIAQWSFGLLFHLVAVHGFFYAPIWCWLLLASAWARRAALLWALLPPLALGIFEKIAFNTSYFGWLLAHRISGGTNADGKMQMASMNPTPGQLFLSPGLWLGLLIAAAFLVLAVRLRQERGPN